MKFPDIPIGSPFLVKDERYLKVGPVTARRESDGNVRMIPRATVVTTDTGGHPASPAPKGTRPAWLDPALAAYEQALVAHLSPAGSDPERRAEVDTAIAEARRAFERTAGDGSH